MPAAIGKSNELPSFLISAGARFTVIFFPGNLKPEFLIAEITLSRLYFTALSGKPTITKAGKPFSQFVSTSTMYASMP